MENVVDVGVLVLGYHGAVLRLEAVGIGDADEAFVPLFEALNWAAAIDWRVSEDFAPDGLDLMPRKAWERRVSTDSTIFGLRFARNVVHHDWTQAVEWTADGWRWRPGADLASERKGLNNYQRELAGKLVLPTLQSLDRTLSLVAFLLDSSGSIAGAARANRRKSLLAPLRY